MGVGGVGSTKQASNQFTKWKSVTCSVATCIYGVPCNTTAMLTHKLTKPAIIISYAALIFESLCRHTPFTLSAPPTNCHEYCWLLFQCLQAMMQPRSPRSPLAPLLSHNFFARKYQVWAISHRSVFIGLVGGCAVFSMIRMLYRTANLSPERSNFSYLSALMVRTQHSTYQPVFCTQLR